MERIRILHCLETVASGGVEQRRLSLARKLPAERFEQQLICTHVAGPIPQQLEEANCKVHEIGGFRKVFDTERYRRALAIIREYKPHIIHGAVFEGVNLATITGTLSSTPIIITEETSDPQNRSWRGNLILKMFSCLAHHMIGVSPAAAAYLTDRLHIPAHKVSLINNGVARPIQASQEVVNAVRQKYGINPDDFLIVTVSRLLDHHKKTSDLIRAMVICSQTTEDIHLLIVGTGPDEQALRDLASELGVESRVHFAGYQPVTQPFYAAADLFALASAYEAFGLVFVEAMYEHLPVVATRVGGVPHVVSDKETGLLVEPHLPDALAQAILRLYADSELRNRMGKDGFERAVSLFSEERYIADVAQLYSSLARKHLHTLAI